MKKILFAMTVVLALLGGYFYFYLPLRSIDKDVLLEKDLVVEDKSTFVIKNGATLTINGDLTIKGRITCESGPLSIHVYGDLNVTGTIDCAYPSQTIPAIEVIAERNITFGQQATVESEGPIRVYGNQSALLKETRSMKEIFESFTRMEPAKHQLGPYVASSSALVGIANVSNSTTAIDDEDWVAKKQVILSGKWNQKVNTIAPSLITMNFTNDTQVKLSQFYLNGENAKPGVAGELACTSTGTNGQDGMRLIIDTGKIVIDGAHIELPQGGRGGDAKTKLGCHNAVASGGEGGKHGNIILRSSSPIEISELTIDGRKGGDGGDAEAIANEGGASCPGETGGAAQAKGGNASGSEYYLLLYGGIAGKENIHTIVNEVASGGYAKALGGRGGNGNDCRCGGGTGGSADAVGGTGGDISLNDELAARDVRSGNGGDADAIAGGGGKGGSCVNLPFGGIGGVGGDGYATPGGPGIGYATGTTGELIHSFGGIGGNGGDGCPNGKGAPGGNGLQNGLNGKDGEVNCVQ